MASTKVTHPHVYSRFDLPEITAVPHSDDVLIDAAAAEETDINHIMSRLGVLDVDRMIQIEDDLPIVDQDFTPWADMDLPAMLRQVGEASDQFEHLPASIRQRFNGVADLVNAFTNPDRAGELVASGIFHANEDGEITDAQGRSLDVYRPADTKPAKKARKKKPVQVEAEKHEEEE